MLLTELHQHYARYAEEGAGDRESVRYYLADIAGDEAADPSLRITGWVRNLHALERFIQKHRRHPRENRRIRVDAGEQRLADWIRFQRRAATRAGHCTYQRLRLETIPGWQWTPVLETWMANARDYQAHLAEHQRPPRYRSADPDERSLAAWAAKQRLRHRKSSSFNERQTQILIALKIIDGSTELAR